MEEQIHQKASFYSTQLNTPMIERWRSNYNKKGSISKFKMRLIENLRAPAYLENPKPSVWVKNKLSNERITMLEGIGFKSKPSCRAVVNQ